MKLNLDFSDTKEFNVPDGNYLVQLKSVEKEQGREFPKLVWDFVVAEGPHKGTSLRFTTSLSPKAAVFVRRALIAFGMSVPQSMYAFDTDSLIGKRVGAKVVNEEGTSSAGEKKVYSNIKELISVTDFRSMAPTPEVPAASKNAQKPPVAASGDDELDIEEE